MTEQTSLAHPKAHAAPGQAQSPHAPSPLDIAARAPHREQPGAPVQTAAPARAAAAPDKQDKKVRAKVTGAQSLVRSLEEAGVEVVFGIPGGAILPAYDPLFDSSRSGTSWSATSRAPGHAATGYAQATGRVGVCMATSRPGCDQPGHPDRRRLHGLACRWSRSPARCREPAIGTDAFQEADICGITLPITKHNFLVTDAGRHPRDDRRGVPHRLHRPPRPGARRHRQGRPAGARPPSPGPTQLDLPGYRPVTRPHAKQVREAARLITEAERPVLYVGGGVLKAHAAAELRQLAELTGIPVVTTLMARGAFPDSHPQHLGHARHARHGRRGHGAAEVRPARSRSAPASTTG